MPEPTNMQRVQSGAPDVGTEPLMVVNRDSETAACGICGTSTAPHFYEIPEMMFGLREKFRYFQCEECGCLQLVDIPGQLGRFYAPGYYAHQALPQRRSIVFEWFRKIRNRYAFTGEGWLGKVLFENVAYYGGEVFRWLKSCGVSY